MRILACLIFISLFTSLSLAENITLQTYYPAPTGVYNNMKSKKLCIGESCINQTVQASDNALYVQEKIGIGNANPEAGLHIGTKSAIGSTVLANSLEDMIISRNLYVGDTLKTINIAANALQITGAFTTNTMNTTQITNTGNIGTNTLTSNQITNTGNISTNTLNTNQITNTGAITTNTLSANQITATSISVTNINIPTTIPANYVLVSNGNGTASWKDMSSMPQESPKGTLCGFWDASGTTFHHYCKNTSVATCPSGYSSKQIAKIDGNKAYSCIKD